jgi:hypothetical protein
VEDLEEYLDLIVQPTFDDYTRNQSLHSDNSYVRVSDYLMLIKVFAFDYDWCNQEA